MTEVIPAIMPDSLDDLENALTRMRGLVSLVQIDVMDGVFVPAKSWPYTRGNRVFDELVAEAEGLPFWEEFDFEFDLMVNRPTSTFAPWVSIGASRLVVHLEGVVDLDVLIEQADEYRSDSGLFDIELGVAVGTETPVERLEPHLEHVDFIQCMGIERVGFQGEPFDERVLEQIKKVRTMSASIPISVDGGVSLDSAPRLVEAGATRLVSGSAIFESSNPAAVIDGLRSL